MACRYPDAESPEQLWENILAQRRAFRRIPDERLPLQDYYSADRSEPDKTYSAYAALIHEFEFDRMRYRIAGTTFRATDIAQWLALQVASDALADAGYKDGTGVPKDSTGVILGNTLTGEVSRANTLRLRWPYVGKILTKTLTRLGLPLEQQAVVLKEAEERFKSAFPPVNHENLAGGLSNTIPGRICNHFDLHGGGYTIDGACAASLLAVTTACSQLVSRDLDLAIAGGVDISLDPFELVGFAKMGAIAEREMFVYDERSSGFLPGEGCGLIVLKRLEDAVNDGNRIYAVIRGWGVSSDGQGGLTTPSTSGQALAVRRAYGRAGYGIETVCLIEGHGTGTTVGDKIELGALGSLLAESTPSSGLAGPSVGIGSIKANIGHTKAAAGIAGLLKTALALHNQILPPMPGCQKPYKAFHEEAHRLYPLRKARLWDPQRPLRAGVSAFGFGGINTHIALESIETERRSEFAMEQRRLIASNQDCELFVFSAGRSEDLRSLLEKVSSVAPRISQAEMADLATELAAQPASRELRAAIVASRPDELHRKLERLRAILDNNDTAHQFSHIDEKEKIFITRGMNPPRIGFLYPGQGVQQINMTLSWGERHNDLQDLMRTADEVVGKIEGSKLSEYMFRHLDQCVPSQRDEWAQLLTRTQIAQPAIVAASVSTTKVLERLGIYPSLAIGYSLGEWTAIWCAGMLSDEDVFRCVAARGRAMAARGDIKGTMATIAGPAAEVQELLDGVNGYVVISGFNSPKQVVISGEAGAVYDAIAECRKRGFAAIPLRVSNAFHSALVSHSAEVLRKELETVRVSDPKFPVVSTITGEGVQAGEIRELLCRQILEPVRFMDAVQHAREYGIDVFVEVGPGRSLGSIMSDVDVSCARMVLCTDDEGGTSFQSMNATIGCLFAMGVEVIIDRWFEARFTRSFNLDYHPRFIQNPCESDIHDRPEAVADRLLSQVAVHSETPRRESRLEGKTPSKEAGVLHDGAPAIGPANFNSILNAVLEIASQITEYPRDSIQPEHLLLRDLNLNSIASAQLVAEVARRIGIPRPADVTEYSTASLSEVATTLFELASTKGTTDQQRSAPPDGISSWVWSFTVEMREQLPPAGPIVNLRDGQRCLIVSGDQHPFTAAFVDRLQSQGIELDFWDGQSAEEYFTSLSVLGKRVDGIVLVLPHPGAHHESKTVDLLMNSAKQIGQLVTEQKLQELFVGLVQFGGGMYGRARPSAAFGGDGNVPQQVENSCGSGVMKSLYLELNFSSMCIIDFSPDIAFPAAASTAVTEFQRATGFVEVGYTSDGTRRVPVMMPMRYEQSSVPGLTADDVLLVTGGGRGIAVDSALAIARNCGCKVALLGRTRPDADNTSAPVEELRATLERFREAQCVCRYDACDVTDPASVRKTMASINAHFGKITAVLHAAGTNIPQAARNLSQDAIGKILAPKLQGTTNLLHALENNPLKIFIAFGSIIAQTGMRGECAYAFANEWMNLTLLERQAALPAVRFLSLNWSVWSGSGMGERLGSIDALVREGITPIEANEGVKELLLLMRCQVPTSEILITGRLGELPTRTFGEQQLPLLRFLEQPKIHYPGIELIVDCELSAEGDSYLKDHLFARREESQRGMQLFPAVMGMEAMVQAASVLAGRSECPILEDLEFSRPIMVPPGGRTIIRIIAQRSKENRNVVDVAIRSEESKFSMNHFRGRCVFDDAPKEAGEGELPAIPGQLLPLNPKTELYGGLLFQGPMFQHLAGYRDLTASSCLAEIESGAPAPVFGRYLPQTLLTGNPTVRDVFLHAIQPCVPHKVILPIAIEKIYCFKALDNLSRLYLHAVERQRTETEFIYDLVVFSPEGVVVEILQGFRCKVIGTSEFPTDGKSEGIGKQLPTALLAPYVERRVQDLYPGLLLSIATDFSTFLESSPTLPDRHDERHQSRKESSRRALSVAIRNLLRQATRRNPSENSINITYRKDGKPEVHLPEGFQHLVPHLEVSVSHSSNMTFAVAGIAPCACDIEPVVPRDKEVWSGLLTQCGMDLAYVLEGEAGETPEVSRTRVWTMIECMKKAGVSRSPLPVFESSTDDGWVTAAIQNEGEEFHILTGLLRTKEADQEIIVGVLLQPATKPATVNNTFIS
jgi:enediyne polyketide synthase